MEKDAPLQPEQILLVEDDPDALDALSELLQLHGFSVLRAHNGQEALDRLRESAGARVIVLDLSMPVMDGWEFLRRRKAQPQIAKIPVIVVTAFPNTGVIDADLVLQKPVLIESLMDALAQFC